MSARHHHQVAFETPLVALKLKLDLEVELDHGGIYPLQHL